jgi:hypothetical protein
MPKGGSAKGGPQSKNLVPLNQRSEEEKKAITSAGGKASVAKRREQKTRDEMFRQILSMGMTKGKVVDPADIDSAEEALQQNIPIYAKIILQEIQKYLLTGDPEARNWLINNAFPVDGLTTFDGSGNSAPANPAAAAPGDVSVEADSTGGVKIVLVRGMKPTRPAADADVAGQATGEATPAEGGGE